MAQMIHVLLLGMFLSDWSLSDTQGGFIRGNIRLHLTPKTWIDALTHCKEKHRGLVVITDDEIERDVNDCLKENPEETRPGAWIGLERSIYGCNVPWLWITGGNFNMERPVNSSHYCGKIKSTGDEVEILSGYCFEELPFICKL